MTANLSNAMNQRKKILGFEFSCGTDVVFQIVTKTKKNTYIRYQFLSIVLFPIDYTKALVRFLERFKNDSLFVQN